MLVPSTTIATAGKSPAYDLIRIRQYEACTTVVSAATWLPPSYTACIVQETAIACDTSYPTSICPAAFPPPQPHPPEHDTDPNQSQSNTSSDASVNFSQGNGGSGEQDTAIIVGVTIGAVVLLILIVVLALRAVRRRRPRRRNAGVCGSSSKDDSRGGAGAGASAGAGTGTKGGSGANTELRPSGRPQNGNGGNTQDNDAFIIPPTSPKPLVPVAIQGGSERSRRPVPTQQVQNNATQPSLLGGPRSRQPSETRRSRSPYRPGDHGEHLENDILYSPGPRRERTRRREQPRREGSGVSADEPASPVRLKRANRNPENVPLPSSPMQGLNARLRAAGEVDRANDDVQSPSTSKWRNGRPYLPYVHRTAEEDGSTA